MKTSIEFTRVNNDVNGNPRYVLHYVDLLTDEEQEDLRLSWHGNTLINEQYKVALKKAKQLGGRKYLGRDFGGGIVFQSYNIKDLENRILKLVNG